MDFFPGRLRIGNHLSSEQVTLFLKQPTRNSNETSSLLFLLGLAPGEGCLPQPLLTAAVVSYSHHFTLTGRWRTIYFGGMFLWPYCRVAPSRVLPGAMLYGVRTFLGREYPLRDHPTSLDSHHNG